ncbi:hypothetical protein SLA2020_194500 [Shorea laevis]
MVGALLEQVPGLLEEARLLENLFTTKIGCLGLGTTAVSLESVNTTSDIVGQSAASSCMHKSATLMHFNACPSLQSWCKEGSINSNTVFSLQSF